MTLNEEFSNPPKKFILIAMKRPIIFIFLSSLLLVGCVTTKMAITETEIGNKNITVENILKIKKGTSTTGEIKGIFGEPNSIVNNTTNGTTTWVYNYTKTKQNTFEPAPFQIDQTQLEIVFNPKGVVTEYTQTVSNRVRKNL